MNRRLKLIGYFIEDHPILSFAGVAGVAGLVYCLYKLTAWFVPEFFAALNRT